MPKFPANLLYTKDHEWAAKEGDLVRVGVTSYAVDQLGDVTLVDLPSVGDDLQAQERFGDIESVKTVSELFAPISGEVVKVNEELESSPELVNEGIYDKGWLVLVQVSDPSELEKLMDAGAYEEYIGRLDH